MPKSITSIFLVRVGVLHFLFVFCVFARVSVVSCFAFVLLCNKYNLSARKDFVDIGDLVKMNKGVCLTRVR